MTDGSIYTIINEYLHVATIRLAEWLKNFLPKISDDWWDECVISNLTHQQVNIVREDGFTELTQLDLAMLLRIVDKSWFQIRSITLMTNEERECILKMKKVRNNWAHTGTILPGKDIIVDDLETLLFFFQHWGNDRHLWLEIQELIKKVKEPAFDNLKSGNIKENSDELQKSVESEIKENSQVYLIGKPDVRGIVTSISDLDGIKKYEVFTENSLKTFYSGQIALIHEKDTHNWLDIKSFCAYLTAYQINNPSGNDLYSLNAARIDFVPYQFRPALKLIHADEPRILIADSVGVGKTIEAGLIIKELEARKELNNIMVICPKPLVTERKWEMEMKRFDEDFVPIETSMMRQILSDTDRDGEWPVRFSKCIVPYSALDGRTYEGEKKKGRHSYGLEDLDPAPHFDLVIVDEAHHIRNGSMEKEKAFEYKCVKYFCDNADAVIMLTATPLQTSNNDLYTLLNILRPDVIIDQQTFYMMSKPNANIAKAASIMRSAKDDWAHMALEELKNTLSTQWGENVIAKNPLFSEITASLQNSNISRETRVKLISDTESLHSFNFMLNRTRRKDIEDFCIRRPYTIEVDFTEYQKNLNNHLLTFESIALQELHGSAKSISFMTSTIKRQAASCIFGIAPHIRSLIDKRFKQLEDDPDSDYTGFKFSDSDADALTILSQDLLEAADNLPTEDPKFDKMYEVISQKQEQENNKIIIFSTFKYTLAYLKRKLSEKNIRVEQIDGSLNDEKRQEIRTLFELPKNDPSALDILLFTEVGSEGLDYQFCNMMINYDLPWNPMKIEQRIGRIDRWGQQSETVSIYNIITLGTVDADIYERCLKRIGIFEQSIGECDEILGEIAKEIDAIVLDPKLTEDEKKIKLEQMSDNEVRKLQELSYLEEEEKEFYGFDLSQYMTTEEIRKAENPWLTQYNIENLTEQYLIQKLGNGTYILGNYGLKQIRLAASARKELYDDFHKLSVQHNSIQQSWMRYLKGNESIHSITFDSEIAEENRDAFFITSLHPLTKQAASYFSTEENAYIHLQYSTEDFKAGTYIFSVYAWTFTGIHPHFKIVIVCDDDQMAEELPEIIQETTTVNIDNGDYTSRWRELEKKQIEMWLKEKQKVEKEAQSTVDFKIESISNNFINRQNSLNQKLQDNNNEKIRRMYRSELEKAEEKYNLDIEKIKTQEKQTDIHTSLIANGIIDIVG